MMLSERVVRGLGLLVEFEILFVLLDDILVGLLEVFGQDDVAIFSHSLHASLRREDTYSSSLWSLMPYLLANRVDVGT